MTKINISIDKIKNRKIYSVDIGNMPIDKAKEYFDKIKNACLNK